MGHKKAVTTGQIAQFCGVHFRTVIRWISRGELKAYRLPGLRADHRINIEDFIDFLTKHEMPIPEELRAENRNPLKQTTRVLIVEDNPTDAKFIQTILEEAGYETKIAENGFSAGAFLTTFRPHLMTLDLNMKELGGMDVIRMVRHMDNFKDVKILVISGVSQEKLEEALAAGADECLRKPVPYKMLAEKIQGLLRKRAAA